MVNTFTGIFPTPMDVWALSVTPYPSLNKIQDLSMQNWKAKLIDAYRLSTVPYRNWKLRQMIKTGQVPVYSLFYHRVSNDNITPWTITEKQFEQQIDWLQKNFEIVDLQESQRRIDSGFNDRPTVSLTFDDGYAENCEFALPMLIERKIPVCYFVSLDFVTKQQFFPHDLNLGLELPINTIESLRALDLSGVEIGAHTRTHLDLGKVTDPLVLADEVIIASKELEQLIGRTVRYFAFPYGLYGNLNSTVFKMLKEHGFLGACSAYGGWNEIGEDAFHIERIHGDPNLERVKNWLSYDPRIARVRSFNYNRARDVVSMPVDSVAEIFEGIDSPITVPEDLLNDHTSQITAPDVTT